MHLSFSRITIFCKDADASLSFYSDLLGLTVVEDKVIEGAQAGALLNLPPCRMRILFLAPSTTDAAVIGLFQILDLDLNEHAPPAGQLNIGQTSTVFTTTDFAGVAARLEAAGVRFFVPPVRYTKAQATGPSPAGIYCNMIAYDPDGLLVGIGQVLPLEAD